ncbi:MAG: zinc ribbon domain-containing protein [Nitrosopumilus sp.]
MVDFSQSLLEKIEYLLNQDIGDSSRLEHIKKSIAENKKLYNSDIQYVEELERKVQNGLTKNPNRHHIDDDDDDGGGSYSGNPCWKCGKDLTRSSKFCSFCGIKQDQPDSEFDLALSRRLKRVNNPLKMISNLHSYQILAVIGGFAALIPILIAMSNMERILEIIEFYTNRDLSGFTIGFIALGGISGLLCSVVILIPFWVKKPKKVGKILFFSSFGILIFSVAVGIVGFVIILFAGILALKKRRY